jgi:hypothetical protein
MTWGLDSDSSGSLWPAVLVDDALQNPLISDELDFSDPSDAGQIFKDSSFFIKNLCFFSAFFLNLISSLSLSSSSINYTIKK